MKIKLFLKKWRTRVLSLSPARRIFFQFCLGDPCGIALIKPASCTVSQFEGDLYGSSLYDGFDGLRDGPLYPVSSFDL